VGKENALHPYGASSRSHEMAPHPCGDPCLPAGRLPVGKMNRYKLEPFLVKSRH